MTLENKDNFERRAQSIVQAVILALVIWVGYSIIGLREATIEMRGQIVQVARENEILKQEVLALKKEITDLKTQLLTATLAAASTMQRR